jgi:hypothetical protein
MAANSALLNVCISACDLISTCVIVWVRGFTVDAPIVRFPDLFDSSIYMKLSGSHAAWNGLIECLMGF